ncbi:MAG: TerC family protein [Planctomycetes bacterium]|nr:TerC family protein [Planctomycetota bacterium]
MTDPQGWIALGTLTLLEIVLGIDNIVFISVLVGRLPQEQRKSARLLGLILAMATRILLLLSLTWVLGLTAPLFQAFSREISARDLILVAGGLFLLAKSTLEIHGTIEDHAAGPRAARARAYAGTLLQIALLDVVFSLDSVITAIGMASHVPVMVLAIVIAVLVMIAAAGAIGRFVDGHPTFKILALSFLVLIGVALVSDGLDFHIPKGYIYFAMAFSVMVELLNMKLRPHRHGAEAGSAAAPGARSA